MISLMLLLSTLTLRAAATAEADVTDAAFLRSLRSPAVAIQVPIPSAPATGASVNALRTSFPLLYARSAGKITVGINPNRELMYSILHLTKYAKTLRNGQVNMMAAAVLSGLKQYDQHPALAELDSDGALNWQKGFSFDEFSAYPGYFSALPYGKRVQAYDDEFLSRVLRGMSREQKIAYLDAYWEKVRDFYRISHFAEFLTKNEGVYRSYVDSVFEWLPAENVVELHESFHGYHGFDRFYIVPSPLNLPPGGSFGGKIGDSICNFMGYGYDDAQAVKFLALHEFGHAFCNPVVESFLPELERYSFLMQGLSLDMQKLHYGSWDGVMYELLVRAVHARLLLRSEGKEAAELFLLREEREFKFVFIRDFYSLLEVYENNRDQYPTLRDFYPRLLGTFPNWRLAEVAEPVSPGLWTTPGPSGLTIDYAEPSGPGYAAGLRDGDLLAAVDGVKPEPAFFLTLAPGRIYELLLERSGGGHWVVSFTAQPQNTVRPVHIRGR